MKRAKKPTVRQSQLIKLFGLNPSNWKVERDTSTEMVVVNLAGQTRSIPK